MKHAYQKIHEEREQKDKQRYYQCGLYNSGKCTISYKMIELHGKLIKQNKQYKKDIEVMQLLLKGEYDNKIKKIIDKLLENGQIKAVSIIRKLL